MPSPDHKTVLVHVYGMDSETARVENAINIAARLAQLRPDAIVTVVVQGPAVSAILEGSGVEPPSTLTNVRLRACAYSLSKIGAEDAALLPGFETVPAAAVFIAEQQWGGSAYIRI